MSLRNLSILFIVGILYVIIALLAPYGYHIDLGPGPNSLMAILWEYWDLSVIRWFTVLQYFPFYFFRFVVIYYLVRFFFDKSTIKKAVIMGIIGELIPLLISIPGVLILNEDGENYIPIMISIPTLLIFHLIVLFSLRKLK